MKRIDHDDGLTIEEHIQIRKENKKWIDERLDSDDPEERYLAEGFLKEKGEYWNHRGLEALKIHGMSEEKFNLLYHDLWSSACETEKYDKAAWTELRFQLQNIGLRV